MKNHPCCVRRATGLAGVLLSGIPLALMPKCPLCIATYATLLTGISVSTTTASQLHTGLITLCLVALGSLMLIFLAKIHRWRRRNY